MSLPGPLAPGSARAQVDEALLRYAGFSGSCPGSELVGELVHRAFDETSLTLEQLRATGVTIDPFRGETTAERAQRISRYADHIRDLTPDDDERALAQARVRELR